MKYKPWLHLKGRILALPLKIQMAITVAFIFACGVSILAVYVVGGIEEDYQIQIGQQQTSAALFLARSLDEDIKIRRNALLALATNVKNLSDHSSLGLQSYLSDKGAIKTLFSRDVYILWKDGSRVAESPSRGTLGASYANVPYFEEVIRSQQPVIKVIMGRFAKKPVLVITVPILGIDGSVLGAFCGTELIDAESFLNLTSLKLNGQTGGFHVYAKNQKIYAASTDPSRVLSEPPPQGVNQLFDKRLQGYLDPGRITDSKGVEIISAAAVADVPNWLVVAYMPTEEAFAPLYRAIMRIYAGAALVILLVGFLTWRSLRHALLPLENAIRKMEAVEPNPFELGLLNVEGSSEIRSLLHNFNVRQTELVQKGLAITAERDRLDSLASARTQELQDLYDQAPCGYHSLSPNGVILRANKTELILLGYAEHEYLGHRITEFMTPESVQHFKENFSNFIKTGYVRNLEFDFICKDGSIRPFLVDGDLTKDAAGAPILTRSTMVDNTLRKAHTEQIRNLNRFLQEVVETLPFGLIVLDETHRIALKNKLVDQLLDYPKDLFIPGKSTFSDFIRFNHERGDYQPRPYEEVLAYFTNAMITLQTVRFERRQANGVYLDVCGKPLSNGMTLLTYTDITAHKDAALALDTALQESKAAMVAKSAFIANMSHEIRTPMNAILGLSYLLQESTLPDEAHSMVSKIRGSGRLLMGILNDVLDFSKIEAGKLEVQVIPFHMGDVLNNLATMMSANAQDKELELAITTVPMESMQLLGDSLRLEQVLINLIGNAIKFTERGHVTVNLRQEHEDSESVTLRFGVCDSGIGIPPEQQQLIFSEFSQADVSTSRKYGGTGLGLTISRRMVVAMGGELYVSSIPGIGSEFWFTLRFKRAPLSQPVQSKVTNLRVFIADDSAVAREALSSAVQCLGWHPSTSKSGDALLRRLETYERESQQPAIVLMDYKMPGTDGMKTVQTLRKELLNPFDVIVMLTNIADRQELMAYPEVALIDTILDKPVTQSILYEAVVHALNARRGDALGTLTSRKRAPRLQGLRILVVDDSEINRELAEQIFQIEGALVSLANDGKEAVDWLTLHVDAIDIVLMDVQMPEMNGYEATRQIRCIPALKDLPVVALTAGAFIEHKELAFESGMTNFIAKPFEVDKTVALIQELTNHTALPKG